MALSEEIVNRALAVASRSAESYAYFFERLESPEWIALLRARGLFGDPPKLEIEDGYVRAPAWAQSQFLARVADSSPDEVLEVAFEIDTENERVHEDLAEAAARMPGPLAARWAERELAWLRDRERLYFLLPDKLAELAIHLARSGEAEVGLRLAFELFRPVGVDREAAGPWDVTTAVTRVTDWHYDMLLEKALPPLLDAAPEATLQATRDLVGQCLDLTQRNPDDPRDDYSYVWRPRVEDEHRDDREPEQALVSALRDLALAARTGALVADEKLLDLLLADQRLIFRRIAMLALTGDPKPEIAVVRGLVLDAEMLRSDHPPVEYQRLLEETAARLDEADRDQLVAWIQEGPDTEEFVRRARRFDDKELTADEVQRYVDAWRARRLRLIRAALAPAQLQDYERLVERGGEQRFALPFEVTTWTGPRSPLSLDDLRQLNDDEIISELERWNARSDDAAGPVPTREGLARALSQFAEEQPERISRLAPRLRGLHAEYTYWSLIGLSAAARAGRPIVWEPLFELIAWLLEQEATTLASLVAGEDEATVFGWARKEVAGLLEAGLASTEIPLPSKWGKTAWDVLATLAEDPDPLPERETSEEGASFDPATLALNATRGRAIRAVIVYGLWVRREGGDDDEAGESAGMPEMPEVREKLNAHLDPRRDPSLAVRSVYGQFFPQLQYLDRDWAATAIPRIFPGEGALAELRDAAWDAYVVFSQPYDDVLEILRGEYGSAISRLGERRPRRRPASALHSPAERLAEHLMSFYWRGRLTLAEDDLVERFFDAAPAELRGHALEFIGRSLREASQIADDVSARLIQLWDRRLAACVAGTKDEAQTELSAFSWWFSAASLPLDWRLSQLDHLLTTGVVPTPEFLVFPVLNVAVAQTPTASVNLFKRYLEQIRDPWAISGHANDLEEILRAALASSDEEARIRAEDTIQWLGALGLRQFRQLLTPQRH